MADFLIERSASNRFYYVFRASNYEPVIHGEEHTTKAACQGSIDAIKRNAAYESQYTRWQTGVHFYFNLKAANGEKIGSNEACNSAQGRENGTNVVKRDASTALMEDRS